MGMATDCSSHISLVSRVTLHFTELKNADKVLHYFNMDSASHLVHFKKVKLKDNFKKILLHTCKQNWCTISSINGSATLQCWPKVTARLVAFFPIRDRRGGLWLKLQWYLVNLNTCKKLSAKPFVTMTTMWQTVILDREWMLKKAGYSKDNWNNEKCDS